MIDATKRPMRHAQQQHPQQQQPSSAWPQSESNLMSHQDIVRYPARGPASNHQAAEDLWMQQQALAVAGQPVQPLAHGGGGGGGNDVQPLKLVHRSLRGRYKLAILLAAVGAAVGCAVGWTQNEKVFRGKGTIRVDPQMSFVNGTAAPQTEYTRFMGSEASYLKTQEFVQRVLNRPEWKNTPGTEAIDAPAFIMRLTSTYGSSLSDIAVTFDHPNRDIAQAAVRAILKGYEAYRDEQRQANAEQSVDYWNNRAKQVNERITERQNHLITVQRDDAEGDIGIAIQHSSERLAQARAKVDDDIALLRRMHSMRDAAKATPPTFTPQQLAAREPTLARLLQDREALNADLARTTRTYGINAPAVRSERDQLASLESAINNISTTLSNGLYGIITPNDPNATVIFVDDAEIARREQDLVLDQQDLQDRQSRVSTQSGVRASMDQANIEIKNAQDELKDINTKLLDAQARSITVNAVVRTFPSPLVDVAEDKRPTMATFGFVAGGALPLCGLVLYGLFDRKYRYSDETTASGSTRGVPLLGILPNLPDRLSDPSQASVAAHCVHQIRTMLQLNVLGEGPSVLSVTSATSGDGKTSLSLALGLSFAASGSRTLLIDTDLIGAGLSARLGIREPHGIGEAIASRDPMSYVRETDVAGLSVLPVGTEGGQNASSFSPSAVRRLIATVRDQFDMILIDTGPVLGSIEATPVVAASDAVILTVARGQNRDLVEKAIGHLRAIGARIAGVVFNRANARDFERSISGISLRSVSRASSLNGNGTNGHQSANGQRQDKRLGPLVHSVRGTREENN